LVMQGQGEAGLRQLSQGLTSILATGQLLAQSSYVALRAEAMGHAGQVEEGLCLLAEALPAFETTGRGDMRSEAYRLQGVVLLQQAVPDMPQAEACFQQALELARHQEAKAFELRAAVGLGRLWQLQGKHQAAYQLLAPIYDWFTEGFDTTDLQKAKAL